MCYLSTEQSHKTVTNEVLKVYNLLDEESLPPSARLRPGGAASARAARRCPAAVRSGCTGAAAPAESVPAQRLGLAERHRHRMMTCARRPLT